MKQVKPDVYRRRMLEAELRKGLADTVNALGGRLFFIRDSRSVPETKDLPDVLIICPPVVMVLELKTETGKHSRGQLEVEQLLVNSWGFVGGTVRPFPRDDCFGYDEIRELLETGSTHSPRQPQIADVIRRKTR